MFWISKKTILLIYKGMPENCQPKTDQMIKHKVIFLKGLLSQAENF